MCVYAITFKTSVHKNMIHWLADNLHTIKLNQWNWAFEKNEKKEIYCYIWNLTIYFHFDDCWSKKLGDENVLKTIIIENLASFRRRKKAFFSLPLGICL